jgi:hypothetical protein
LLPYGISSLQNLYRGKFVNTMFENLHSQFVAVTGIAHCTLAWMCLNTADLAFDPRVTLIKCPKFLWFSYFCVVLCICCFVSSRLSFVCKCVLSHCHRVATQLQLTNVSYHNPMYAHRQNGQGVMLTSASRAEVMNEWIYTSAPPVCLHGTCSLATVLPLLRPLQWIWAEQSGRFIHKPGVCLSHGIDCESYIISEMWYRAVWSISTKVVE